MSIKGKERRREEREEGECENRLGGREEGKSTSTHPFLLPSSSRLRCVSSEFCLEVI